MFIEIMPWRRKNISSDEMYLGQGGGSEGQGTPAINVTPPAFDWNYSGDGTIFVDGYLGEWEDSITVTGDFHINDVPHGGEILFGTIENLNVGDRITLVATGTGSDGMPVTAESEAIYLGPYIYSAGFEVWINGGDTSKMQDHEGESGVVNGTRVGYVTNSAQGGEGYFYPPIGSTFTQYPLYNSTKKALAFDGAQRLICDTTLTTSFHLGYTIAHKITYRSQDTQGIWNMGDLFTNGISLEVSAANERERIIVAPANIYNSALATGSPAVTLYHHDTTASTLDVFRTNRVTPTFQYTAVPNPEISSTNGEMGSRAAARFLYGDIHHIFVWCPALTPAREAKLMAWMATN